jgi:hypothetical protein
MLWLWQIPKGKQLRLHEPLQNKEGASDSKVRTYTKLLLQVIGALLSLQHVRIPPCNVHITTVLDSIAALFSRETATILTYSISSNALKE